MELLINGFVIVVMLMCILAFVGCLVMMGRIWKEMKDFSKIDVDLEEIKEKIKVYQRMFEIEWDEKRKVYWETKGITLGRWIGEEKLRKWSEGGNAMQKQCEIRVGNEGVAL